MSIINQHKKQEIITRIRAKGEKFTDLAKKHGIWLKTIYNLLRNKVNQPNIALCLARLARERDALLKVVGELFVENKMNKEK
jgi:lambda repressor-like predicted transcriptional regulator